MQSRGQIEPLALLPVGVGELAHVDEDLVAEDVEVQLVADVEDELQQALVPA